MAKQLEIRQIKSIVGRQQVQKRTIEALGIKRIHQRVVHEDTPQIRGMIRRVIHLVEVREIE